MVGTTGVIAEAQPKSVVTVGVFIDKFVSAYGFIRSTSMGSINDNFVCLSGVPYQVESLNSTSFSTSLLALKRLDGTNPTADEKLTIFEKIEVLPQFGTVGTILDSANATTCTVSGDTITWGWNFGYSVSFGTTAGAISSITWYEV
jgi:alpha-tubulin suppressor-like RCC1 family protein